MTPSVVKSTDIVVAGKGQLSWVERMQIRTVRKSFEHGMLSNALRLLQQNVSSRWMTFCVKNIAHFHHLERLPAMDPKQSFILVSNHRSFFDMWVVSSELVRSRIADHRIFFPVRSTFFYDNLFGFAVNGLLSCFAMYPPVFRDKDRRTLNVTGLNEIVRLLNQGGTLLGIHPEGTRNRGNPYELLPFQGGIGRIVHGSKATVIPVFTNGLETDDLAKQVLGNFLGGVQQIHTVFGEPIDYGTLLKEKKSPKVFQAITDKTCEVINQLGREERAIRFPEGNDLS